MNMCISEDKVLLEWMRDIRRTLHQYPELSYQEHLTSKYIQKKLNELAIPFRSGLGKTGIVATIEHDGSGKEELREKISAGTRHGGGHVGLRADMDALPVEETSDIPYASKAPGKMHACGHDGHVAMLLGAAAILKKSSFNGCVSCIFQPAEEHGNGAESMIKDGVLDGGVQVVFAGHIDTHFPTGVITVDEGLICSYADPFSITLGGQSGHAARPHEARDPLVAGAYLVTALQTLISRETDPNHAAVVTVGSFQAGNAHNIIADQARIDGTIRTSHPEVRIRVVEGMRRIVEAHSSQFNVKGHLSFHDCLPAVVNSKEATAVARKAAWRTVGRERVVTQGKPSLGAEDFSFYQQVLEGCLVRFGADSLTENSPAHSGTFNFDEDVLMVGANWLASVALEWLKHNQGVVQ